MTTRKMAEDFVKVELGSAMNCRLVEFVQWSVNLTR